MRRIQVDLDDSVYERVLRFLELLPENMIKITEKPDLSHIPDVPEDEAKNIQDILGDPESHEDSRRKNILL